MKKAEEEVSETLDEQPHIGWEKNARVVSGFKDGDGDVPITNWLLKLPTGSIFLVMNKLHPDLLCEYKILHKFPEAVRLSFDDFRGVGEVWVEPELFIKKNDFIKVLIEGMDD